MSELTAPSRPGVPWWRDPRGRAGLVRALEHVNAARRPGLDDVSRVANLANAINQLFRAREAAVGECDGGRGDVGALEQLLRDLPEKEQETLLDRDAVSDLASFTPRIVSGPARGSDPPKEHDRLERRILRYRERPNASRRRGCLRALAELVWVVRSNVQHGEKVVRGSSPHGERDAAVAAAAIPVLELAIDAVLDRPSESLLCYGSLRPGEANDDVLADMPGSWLPAIVTGELTDWAGYPKLLWRTSSPAVPAELLRSPSLTTAWDRLDRFEGDAYVRWLVLGELAEGPVVANCFVASDR